jgi:adenosine deaminase
LKDLHLHLSGGSSKKVIWEVIKNSGYKTGLKTYDEFSQFTSLIDKKNLDNYLDVLHWVDRAQSSPMGMRNCVYDVFAQSAISGCTYLELRMNIVKRSQEGVVDLDSLVSSARSGMEEAQNVFGIEGGLILCMGTDCTPEANNAIFQKALKYHKKGVIGIDIAGPYFIPKYESKDEYYRHIQSSYDRHDFRRMYETANAKGMTTTVHAGEVGHTAVKEELDYVLTELKPQRIGHGCQLYKYPELLDKARNTHFEFCISSNLSTGSIKSLKEYAKVYKFFSDNSLEFSVNTDATFLLDTNIKKENDLMEEIVALARELG